MTTEETKKDTVEKKVETKPEAVSDEKKVEEKPKEEKKVERKPREFKKNRRTSSRRRERPKSEFDQRILDIRRVTRVSPGGRRFSFAVSMAIGDRKGRLGIGTGKAGDTAMAIDKAVRNAKKNMITVKTTSTNSIPHDVKQKYSSARIVMMPAPGRGIVAGSALRDCLELAGVNDVNGKIISGSKNKLNIAKATQEALESMKEPVGKDAKKVVKK